MTTIYEPKQVFRFAVFGTALPPIATGGKPPKTLCAEKRSPEKRVKILLFIYIAFSYIQGFSQIGFNEMYHFNMKGANGEGLVKTQQAPNDQLLFYGITGDSILPQKYRLFISNKMANIEQPTTFFSKPKKYSWFTSASMTEDSILYLSGHYGDSSENFLRGVILKLSTQGDTLGLRTFRNNENHIHVFPGSHVMDVHQNIYVVYLKDSIDNQYHTIRREIMVSAFDSALNVKWERIWKQNTWNYTETYPSITLIDNQLVVTGGRYEYTFYMGKSYIQWESVVLVYDLQGNLLKSYLSPYGENIHRATAILATTDGGYLYSGERGFELIPSGSAYYQIFYKGYIEKLDSNLQRQWTITVGRDSCQFTEMRKIIPTKDGNYVFVGTDALFLPSAAQYDSVMYMGWIGKISPSGQVLWQRHYKKVYSQTIQKCEHYLKDIVEMEDGGFGAVGVIFDYNPDREALTNAWLVRTDSFGCLVPGCQLVGIADNSSLKNSLKLYPNPASEQLYLYYHNPQLHNCVFSISDMAGRLLVPKTALESSTTYEIPIQDWAVGVYFVQVQDEKGNVYTEKFIKE